MVRLVSAAVMDGPMACRAFARWDSALGLRPGDIVEHDHVPRPHTKGAARAAVGAAGCELRFLPPYSPDLNPIEMAFSKLKSVLRGLTVREPPLLAEWLGWLVHLFDPRSA